MMMNLVRRSAIAIGRQSKSKLTSFSSSASSQQPCSGIPKSLISVLQSGASRRTITSWGLTSLDSTGAKGLLFRPQASICTETTLPKMINSSYLARSFASSRTSKEPGNQQNKAKKEVTTVEDPFDSPTYHIPEKPVTFTEGASYSLVILAGLAVAGAAGYGVFKELIFQPKEYKIFDKALKRIQDDGQVRVRIGSPIKGYGQETRNRAARQRIPNRVFTDEDGVEHVEVNFYIRGPQGAGKVYAEMFKDKAENEWKYTYLIVEVLTPSPAKLMLESYLPA
ncbi:PREDICTED: probable mitochondrial import inner membrane translocase subunit TIM21 [Camelina sativa]|uniref:Mitochondrial import inner membrane translocase subunit Tim21 n=1 Tax=Camelina sativa TaxID=90675 RepID=A0ABM0VUZ9_CAMSA|nr:PREDICTED: probable mitochondrial import inner membrane translocase subunit TIM21 [Camelina sativa]